ncbi:PTS lactose/cellobiose transporter subunit IIA, partial [Staphylococcus epidermidis]|uniref:PTS lactose/cellobiose transporter subunit IIA n=1 Tax=Staphylococcus epidermidis TaxID=1282 RepID=UPI001642C0B6
EQLVEEGNECIGNGHKGERNVVGEEGKGEDMGYSMSMIDGEEDLMRRLVLKDLMKDLIEL